MIKINSHLNEFIKIYSIKLKKNALSKHIQIKTFYLILILIIIITFYLINVMYFIQKILYKGYISLL